MSSPRFPIAQCKVDMPIFQILSLDAAQLIFEEGNE